MCLVVFSLQPGAQHPLVVTANRDEVRARPSAPLQVWSADDAQPTIAAGKDLKAGGMWLGTTAGGRFAALTNFPDNGTTSATSTSCAEADQATTASTSVAADAPPEARISRGTLVKDFLESEIPAEAYVASLSEQAHRFDGFNLLVYDGTMVYCTNRGGDCPGWSMRVLREGSYALANAELLRQPEWPKATRSKAALETLRRESRFVHSDLFAIVADRSQPPDADLPQRGKPIELERRLAPCFVMGAEYGTINSTVVVFDDTARRVDMTERSFGTDGTLISTAKVELHYT